jgi:phosphatidylglycerol:prolipoprotein diacylglycerol transferase
MAMVALAGFIGGVLGAKITQIVFQGLPTGVPWTALLDPRVGGKALLGGVVFGWMGVVLAKRYLGIKRGTGDLFALALPAGEAVGRIGCFFNGCCYGTVCDLPWAVEQHGALRHPAQLYTALISLGIFLLLLKYRAKLPREGDLFKLYLLLFGSSRFLLEFLRQNDTFWFGLTPMQWFCLELMVVAGITLRRRKGLERTASI